MSDDDLGLSGDSPGEQHGGHPTAAAPEPEGAPSDLDPMSMQQLLELAQAASEDLHPDLQPYVRENALGGSGLFHPLVFDPFLTMPGMANKTYLAKTEELGQAMARGAFHTVVFLHERPYRLDAYLNIVDFIPADERPALLRQIWTDTENAWQSSGEWVEAFEALDNPRAMMRSEETSAFDALPEKVTVYRGCQEGLNEEGLSWTADADTAVWFAKRWAEHRDQVPIVLRGVVPKSSITVLLSSREPEIVLLPYNQPEPEALDPDTMEPIDL